MKTIRSFSLAVEISGKNVVPLLCDAVLKLDLAYSSMSNPYTSNQENQIKDTAGRHD